MKRQESDYLMTTRPGSSLSKSPPRPVVDTTLANNNTHKGCNLLGPHVYVRNDNFGVGTILRHEIRPTQFQKFIKAFFLMQIFFILL